MKRDIKTGYWEKKFTRGVFRFLSPDGNSCTQITHLSQINVLRGVIIQKRSDIDPRDEGKMFH